MKPRVTIQEIHRAMCKVQTVGESTLTRRASREAWACHTVPGIGRSGRTRQYFAAMLPSDVQMALKATNMPAVVETLPTLEAHKNQKIYHAQEEKAYAKTELASSYKRRLSTAGYGAKREVRRLFIEAYNMGDAGSMPAVYKVVGPVDLNGKTINGWITRLNKNGWDPFCLADKRGFCNRGNREITPEQTKIILRIIRSPLNRPGSPVSELIRHAMEVMDYRGINNLSPETYRRWLKKDWVPYHYDEWIWWKEGDTGLNDKVSRSLFRDYSKIEPGDILVADGHVLNFKTLDPITGKPKRMMLVLFYDMKSSYPLGWEIMATENTEAISVALRRAILRLGKIPTIVYLDNGRAFKGKYFTSCEEDWGLKFKGVYARLGIRLIIAKPYHGQSKTIERFFKTMGELERLALTAVGENIQNKPAYLNRGEKLHRKVHEKITRGVTPTLEDTHRAVGIWFDKYCNRPQTASSHIAGRTPAEVMAPGIGPGIDPVKLRCLMMRTKEVRIRKEGIKFIKQWFYHPDLYGQIHPIYIRYDLQYRDSILVFDQVTEELVCEATIQKLVHPAASILGTDEDRAELARQSEMKASLRKRTIASALEIVDTQVVPAMQQQAISSGFSREELLSIDAPEKSGGRKKKVAALPAPLTDAEIKRVELELAQIEVESEEDLLETYIPEVVSEADDEEDIYIPEVVNEVEAMWDELSMMDETDRFEKLIELEVRGILIPSQYQAWMQYFEQTPAYKSQEEYYSEYRSNMVLTWQATAEAV